MVNIIYILGLLVVLGGGVMYFIHTVRKAGRNEIKLDVSEASNKALKDENNKITNRPRGLADRLDRLRRWRDKRSKQ